MRMGPWVVSRFWRTGILAFELALCIWPEIRLGADWGQKNGPPPVTGHWFFGGGPVREERPMSGAVVGFIRFSLSHPLEFFVCQGEFPKGTQGSRKMDVSAKAIGLEALH